MKRTATISKKIFRSAVLALLAVASIATLLNACSKAKEATESATINEAIKKNAVVPLVQHQPITSVVTIAHLRTSADGSSVRAMFCQNEEIFTVSDPVVIATLKKVFNNKQAVQITFDPWQATVSQATVASSDDQDYFHVQATTGAAGVTFAVNATTPDEAINRSADMGVINTTTTGLTGVIPDMATAQLMFDYIAHQCCQLPGPYAIDYCITFQYCPDGCYARAHKMCWILNNTYHYATQKVFSFANDAADVDELCVQAEKWGGCCINWWYHVAPLVTIKTAAGAKAYVFDPAMFDHPVTLATWLHFQENPTCIPAGSGDLAQVTMINIQPTTSYSPTDYSGYDFDTDPYYVHTNGTLTSYRYLISCP